MKFSCVILILNTISACLGLTNFLHLTNEKFIFGPQLNNVHLVSYKNTSEIFQSLSSCTNATCNTSHTFNMYNFIKVTSTNKQLLKNLCISTNLFQKCFNKLKNNKQTELRVFKVAEVINNNTYIDFIKPVITHSYVFSIKKCNKVYKLKVIVKETDIVSLLFFNENKFVFNNKSFYMKKNKCVY